MSQSKLLIFENKTNQSMLNGKQLFQWKLEKIWSFDKARNVLIDKNRDENIFY